MIPFVIAVAWYVVCVSIGAASGGLAEGVIRRFGIDVASNSAQYLCYCALHAAPDHSGLMPANLITLVHLSIFSAMNLATSSGEFGDTATAPRSASRCLMLGSSTAALVCLLSVAMISGGVPLGTPKPIQPAAS